MRIQVRRKHPRWRALEQMFCSKAFRLRSLRETLLSLLPVDKTPFQSLARISFQTSTICHLSLYLFLLTRVIHSYVDDNTFYVYGENKARP